MKPFLENAAVGARVPVRSLDYTLCFISYREDDDAEMCVRTASDFVRERMLSETRYGGETLTELVDTDGQVRMRDPVSGKPTVVPGDQAGIVKRSFD